MLHTRIFYRSITVIRTKNEVQHDYSSCTRRVRVKLKMTLPGDDFDRKIENCGVDHQARSYHPREMPVYLNAYLYVCVSMCEWVDVCTYMGACKYIYSKVHQ